MLNGDTNHGDQDGRENTEEGCVKVLAQYEETGDEPNEILTSDSQP